MVYAYAAVITIAVTAAIVLFPMWLRGGREAVIASGRWTIPLFGGLAVIMVFLAIVLQQPVRNAATAVLSAASAGFAALWLALDASLSRWVRAALSLIVILGSAVALFVLLGGLQ